MLENFRESLRGIIIIIIIIIGGVGLSPLVSAQVPSYLSPWYCGHFGLLYNCVAVNYEFEAGTVVCPDPAYKLPFAFSRISAFVCVCFYL
jgi:hypothetical protein